MINPYAPADRALFGPAGNSERFYAEGYKKSEQAPAWIGNMGLNAFEYSAGHGVLLSEGTARAIGDACRAAGVFVSLHAPYYINCASPDREEKNIDYLLSAARALWWMGGRRVVVHVGSPGKLPRAQAMENVRSTLNAALERLSEEGLGNMLLCPETMGRPSQLGTLEEILSLCAQDQRMLPTLDFGHLHTIGLGALKTSDDFRRVLDQVFHALDEARARACHIHFSKIEFTAKGEKQHRQYGEEGFGPDFSLLAPLLWEYKMTPVVICESRGTQADDACLLKALYERAGDAGQPRRDATD